MPRRARQISITLALLAGFVVPIGPTAAQRVNVITRQKIVLEVQPLTAAPVDGTPSPLRLEIDPEAGGVLEFDAHWPEPADRCSIRLRASEIVPPGEADPRISLSAEVRFADGTTGKSERRLAVNEATAALFEAYRLGDRSLTFGISTEFRSVSKVQTAATVGTPVRLRVEVQRVEAGRAIPLETNHLNTFVGEPVSYAFRLGPPENTSITLQLKPLRITGELIKIEVNLTGSLPGENGANLTSRREEWITSRGASSTAALESGQPPSGYRFLVTPQF